MDDELMTQVEESGYSLEEILIIASLIEKETDGKDRTNIASVIYNRLNNVGETYHKLEIDAAVIYGLGYANGENYAGPLTQADLDKDTPYNLRMHEGLPPTPICNPGLASIRAGAGAGGHELLFLRARQGRRASLLQDLPRARQLCQLQPVRRLRTEKSSMACGHAAFERGAIMRKKPELLAPRAIWKS